MTYQRRCCAAIPSIKHSSLDRGLDHLFSEDGPAAIIELLHECCQGDIAVMIKKQVEQENNF